jgi:MoxR-like ATPase
VLDPLEIARIVANIAVRDQPRPGQGAERAARGDAGAPGDDRRRDVPAADAVPGPRHPEPIEQEGTYPLPEAQVDRFMLKLSVGYPSREEERQILDRMAVTNPDIRVAPVTNVADIVRMRGLVDGIYLDDKVKEYVIDLVMATREPQTFKLDLGPYIQYGASPRATLYLTLAAKAHAFINGRGYVTPQDVKSIGADVLRHRVTISYEAEAEELTSDAIIQRIFDGVPVP